MNEMTNSHILINKFAYLEPASLEEAVSLLAQYGERARVLAGGTDLLVHMKMERIAPDWVICLNKIPGLDGILIRDGRLGIGALTTIQSVYNDARIQAHYVALAEACDSFSTKQVQVMGTLGGNLCNGSPASDSAPALIAFGAEVVVVGPEGERRLPLDQFFLSPGETTLQKGELLTRVLLPRPRPETGSAFLKISRVAADIAKANAAVVLERQGDSIVACRMAFGSVAPTPVRARQAEAMLAGQPFSESLIAGAARLASEEVSPIDDVRSEAWYRREVVRVMAYDGLQRAWERAGHNAPVEWPAETAERPKPTSSLPALRVEATELHQVELKVNGRKHKVWVAPNDLLLNVLRDKLQLTGTKYGCGIGECSACTVLLDGKLALACLVLAVLAEGRDIQTVEGLQGPNGELDPLQEAFIEYAAFQCGYCTPGVLMTAKSLLAENPQPSEDQVRSYLRGNLCRCTGYASIVRAVMSFRTE